MSLLPFACPAPPGWRVDWEELDARYEWIRAMRGCPQDAAYHGEGDVWTHARMVCEALAEMAAWRALPAAEREIVFGAALLHDVAKPVCTRRDNAGIHSRGHSRRGAIEARSVLWRMGADFAAREQVCAMARYHLAPFHLVNRSDARRLRSRSSA